MPPPAAERVVVVAAAAAAAAAAAVAATAAAALAAPAWSLISQVVQTRLWHRACKKEMMCQEQVW